MLEITGGAPRLLDDVVDDRRDGVVAEEAAPRTVVVHDVAEPKPARLHQIPRKGGSV
jgi:hypothetical protein